MKIVCLVAVLALLTGVAPPASLVQIHGISSHGQPVAVDGIIVSTGSGLGVATAARTLADLHTISVETQTHETLAVERINYIHDYDLVLLRTAATKQRYAAARLATSSTNGQAADIWGFSARGPAHGMPATIVGTAVHFEPTQASRLGLMCDACGPGDAGAGIFAKDGSLLGIIAARWDYANQQSFMEGEPVTALDEVTASR